MAKKTTSQEQILTFLRAASSIMSSEPELADTFKNRIIWLKEREAIWTNHLWRIALIGVTSSGKSTLVNALLDDNALPVRVRPSSNSLVICRWGNQRQAIVHFENGGKEVLDGKTLTTRLKELSDESTNQDNSAGVKEIELQWPGFRLGKDVALVDTPGLDAYNKERHEKLTLETLLPTVDLVIFLTTAKVNADALIAEYLDRIHAHGKPLIVVQNMMDSIEEKKGMGGVVERSREEVAGEHFRRLSRLVHGRSWGHDNNVPIIQISAHLAIKNEFDKSNIKFLINTVSEKLLILEPLFCTGRLNQLLSELNKIIIAHEPDQDVENGYNENIRQKQKLESFKAKIKDEIIAVQNEIDESINQCIQSSKIIENNLANFSPKNIDEINITIEKLKAWLGKIDDALSCIVKRLRYNTLLPSIKLLNLREEDLYFEYRSAQKTSITNPIIKEKRSVSVREKPGGFSRFLRKMTPESWGWGREEYETIWKEVENVSALRAGILGAIANELQWASGAKREILHGTKKIISVIVREIEREILNLEAPTRTQLQKVKQKAVIASLKNICDQIKSVQPDTLNSQSRETADGKRWADPPVQIEVPPLLLDMARYADLVSRGRFLHLRQALLNRAAERGRGNPTRVLIWGFDGDSMERFLGRFWFDVIAGKPEPGRCFEVLEKSGHFQTIAVAMETPPSQGPPNLSALGSKFLKTGNSSVFVLLDALQVGSTESQWRRSALHCHVGEAGGFILVIQSIAGLDEPDRLAEGLWEILKFARSLTPPPVGILVNDDEAIWTVLADALYTEGDNLRTHADIQNWVGQMAIEDRNLEANVVKVLWHWHDRSKIDRSWR